MRKTIFCLFVFTFCTVYLFSQSMYVCLGSFRVKQNAINYVESLKEFDLIATIDEQIVGGQTMYRVVLAEAFGDLSVANQRCQEVGKMDFVKKFNIKDLWIAPSKNKPEKKVITTSTTTTTVPPVTTTTTSTTTTTLPPVTTTTTSTTTTTVPPVTTTTTSTTTTTVPPVTTTTTSTTTTTLPPVTTTTTTTVVLQKNENVESEVNEETPYSVKIRTYKEEKAAENDRDRLRKQDINAYILKNYDDKEYFSFDLHAGAFDNEEDAEILQEQLEDLGISDTEISNYEDIKESLDKYNEIVDEEEVIFRGGNTEIPTIFSPYLTKCIKQFPINENYALKSVNIYDFDNYEKHELEIPKISSNRLLAEGCKFRACSIAEYEDLLFGTNVYIEIANGDDYCISDTVHFNDIKLAITNDTVDCMFYESDSIYYLFGINPMRNTVIVMQANGFSRQDFLDFLADIENDSNLLFYPQVRKSLLVLPNENEFVSRDFYRFNLCKITELYAEEREYVDWSLPIVGHWNSEGYFFEDNLKCEVSFFDMDYDYNAKRVHKMFMDEHSLSYITEYNHDTDVNGQSGWYVYNLKGGEISFSRYSYIVAVDSEVLAEQELLQFAEELQIWDE